MGTFRSISDQNSHSMFRKTTLNLIFILKLAFIATQVNSTGLHRFPRSNGWTLNSIGYNAGLGALSRMFGGEKPQRGFKRASRTLMGAEMGSQKRATSYYNGGNYLRPWRTNLGPGFKRSESHRPQRYNDDFDDYAQYENEVPLLMNPGSYERYHRLRRGGYDAKPFRHDATNWYYGKK